jgi:hypothetical protein
LYPFGITNAPVRKGKNIEYIVHLKTDYRGCKEIKKLVAEVEAFIKNGAKIAQ